MKSYLTSKTLIIGSAILLIGAVVAFAHGGRGGYGGYMMGSGGGYAMGPGMMGGGYGMGPGMMGGGYGMGPGMMGYGPGYTTNGNGYGYGANLTDEQRSRLEASQEKFANQTQGLREDIRDQRDALQTELRSDHPDEARIAKLQKTLSGLQADYNQKVVEHQLEMRKIAPEAGGGSDYGRGYGGYYGQ